MLSLLGCVLGLPQMTPEKSTSAAASIPATASEAAPAATAADGASSTALSKRQGHFGGGFGGGFGGPQFRSDGQAVPHHERNWGPKAWGPGLNNPWAWPVNPFVMERALALTERCPGTLARVGVDGEVMITDQNGFEVEILDWFGNEITDGINDFEFFEEPTFYMGAPGFGGSFGGSFGIPPPGFGASPGNGAAQGAAGRSSFGQSPCFRRPTFRGFFDF